MKRLYVLFDGECSLCEWSQRLAHPALLPWARRVCELLSENRFRVSRWFDKPSARQLAEKLATKSTR